MTLKSQLRSVVRSLRDRVLLGVESVSEGAVARAAIRSAESNPSRSGHILIVAPGAGSVGDEAMYQAFSTNSPPPVTVVVRAEKDLIDPGYQAPGTVVVLNGILYGRRKARRRDLETLLNLVAGSESLSIVGADIMDGVYALRSSVRRFRTAELATRVGAAARITGFSWNEAPAPAARAAMRKASKSVTLLARDPVSASRLRADGAASVQEVADLAFLTPAAPVALSDSSVAAWLDQQDAAGRSIVIVNANPVHLKRFPEQTEAYVTLINEILAAGMACLLLPHDGRNGEKGEIAYQERLAARITPTDAFLWVPHVLPPRDVVTVAARAKFVVAGRMHLVVLSGAAGTPSVGLEYQGKFSGLYELLGFDGRISLDGDRVSDRLRERFWESIEAEPQLRATLKQQQPNIFAKARLNLPIQSE